MYLVLLAFGALLTAAGVLLAASGISIHDRAYDGTIFTPGIVAAVGGLLLIGLGLALRVLQRIEQALSVRPMPRALRPGEVVPEPATVPELAEPARIPFAPKPRPQPGPISVLATPLDDRRAADAEKSPALPRLESPGVADEAETSTPSPKPAPATASSRVDEAIVEVDRVRAARRRNGAASVRITPRLDAGARPAPAPERPKGPAFDSLWPKGPRPVRAAQAAPVPLPTPEPAEEPIGEPAADVPAAAGDDASVSVLKSGVVDGMGYTLYSDGSIEAQLPQGTLRFGSITDLRHHLEQSA